MIKAIITEKTTRALNSTWRHVKFYKDDEYIGFQLFLEKSNSDKSLEDIEQRKDLLIKCILEYSIKKFGDKCIISALPNGYIKEKDINHSDYMANVSTDGPTCHDKEDTNHIEYVSKLDSEKVILSITKEFEKLDTDPKYRDNHKMVTLDTIGTYIDDKEE